MVTVRYVGGATGLQLLRTDVMAPFGSYTRMLFVVMALLAVVAVSVARYIQVGWIGRGLRAIRGSEEAAECSGVPALRLKLVACVVSGALMGAAGAPMPMYLSFIEPASSFSLNWGVSALAITVILAPGIGVLPRFGFVVAAFLAAASLLPLIDRNPFRAPLATWGMVIAHFGIAVALAGMAANAAFSSERLAVANLGERLSVGP
jgi:branched-chain amino acid transport system permease protein